MQINVPVCVRTPRMSKTVKILKTKCGTRISACVFAGRNGNVARAPTLITMTRANVSQFQVLTESKSHLIEIYN